MKIDLGHKENMGGCCPEPAGTKKKVRIIYPSIQINLDKDYASLGEFMEKDVEVKCTIRLTRLQAADAYNDQPRGEMEVRSMEFPDKDTIGDAITKAVDEVKGDKGAADNGDDA